MLNLIKYGLFYTSGILMWVMEIISFNEWWGGVGLLLALFVPPLAILFPFIYWIKTTEFPLTYFIIWAIGLGGFAIPNLFEKKS